MKEHSVASSHSLSTRAGMKMLELGGNAYDAAIATSAALTVVQPHLNGLGGDFFAIVDDSEISAINGNGYAAALATIDYYESHGFAEIPKRGHLASFSVPGLVASWTVLMNNASLPLTKLLEPAIRYATDGFRATPAIERSIMITRDTDADWDRIYRGMGGDGILRQQELGKTLEAVASDQGYSFYHGDIARAIESDMVRKGGLMRFSDLDGYQPVISRPLSVRYRGFDVYTNPPSSQGATALMWLNILNRHDLSSMDKLEYYSQILAAMKTAYSYRARYITDPGWLPFRDELLSPDYSYEDAKEPAGGGISHSDTTAFSVFDGEIGISAIQSNYMGFGSGHNIGGTGINMNNRGVYFTLDREHHNALAPGKKTMHTLMATLAKGEKTIYTSSMGGDVQPQINVQVLCNLLDRGYGMQKAISEPRFAYPASIYGDSDILYERDLGLHTGKPVDNLNSLMGHAQGILVGDTVETGIDPRGDGLIKYE